MVSSHIEDGQDFFHYEPEHWDILVSNPPFSMKDKVLKRAQELGKPFALLLPITTLQGQRRFPYLKDIQLLTFDKRICYHKTTAVSKGSGAPFASGYFCKDLLPKDLIIEEL